MSYLLDIPRMDSFAADTWPEINRRWAEYRSFLDAANAQLNPKALDFARAPWHYDTRDSRCIYSAKLVGVEFGSAGTERNKLRVRLLSRSETGYIEFRYSGVVSCSLGFSFETGAQGPRDLLIDELGVGENGCTVHSLAFASGDSWRIEFSDIDVDWIPQSNAT
jgi:hypothetical protein